MPSVFSILGKIERARSIACETIRRAHNRYANPTVAPPSRSASRTAVEIVDRFEKLSTPARVPQRLTPTSLSPNIVALYILRRVVAARRYSSVTLNRARALKDHHSRDLPTRSLQSTPKLVSLSPRNGGGFSQSTRHARHLRGSIKCRTPCIIIHRSTPPGDLDNCCASPDRARREFPRLRNNHFESVCRSSCRRTRLISRWRNRAEVSAKSVAEVSADEPTSLTVGGSLVATRSLTGIARIPLPSHFRT